MYLQIVEQIERRVAVGDWQLGGKLTSIRALALSLKVSVITVKRAYFELERLGAIITRQGQGSSIFDSCGAQYVNGLLKRFDWVREKK